MENTIRDLQINFGKIDQRHARLILAIITLILLVLGAGAPSDVGGFSS